MKAKVSQLAVTNICMGVLVFCAVLEKETARRGLCCQLNLHNPPGIMQRASGGVCVCPKALYRNVKQC